MKTIHHHYLPGENSQSHKEVSPHPVIMSFIQKTKKSVDDNGNGTVSHFWQKWKLINTLWETLLGLLKNLLNRNTLQQSIQQQQNQYVEISTVPCSLQYYGMAKKWKTSECLLSAECIKKNVVYFTWQNTILPLKNKNTSLATL